MSVSHPTSPPAGSGPPLTEAIGAVAEQIAALVRPVADTAVPIPGSQWTVGESAAHVLMVNELMAEHAGGRHRAHGDGSAASLAAANAESLAAFTERDGSVLADGIVRHAKAFTDVSARRPGDEPTDSPLGPMDLATLGSYFLTHMLAHGYDIAAALRRPHMIDRDRVALSVPFLVTGMPLVVNEQAAAGHNACYDVRLRGASRFVVTFTDGAPAVTAEPPRRPDCTIMAEPVAYFLVALGRRNLASAISRGKIVAWGRKPWLAPGFRALFTPP
jgi:uncharacterized protein (TIGR03083 family)